jgi:hypothetical protein
MGMSSRRSMHSLIRLRWLWLMVIERPERVPASEPHLWR